MCCIHSAMPELRTPEDVDRLVNLAVKALKLIV